MVSTQTCPCLSFVRHQSIFFFYHHFSENLENVSITYMVDLNQQQHTFLVCFSWMVHGSDLHLYILVVLLEHPLTAQLCPPIIKINKTKIFFIIYTSFLPTQTVRLCLCWQLISLANLLRAQTSNCATNHNGRMPCRIGVLLFSSDSQSIKALNFITR